MRRLLIIVLVVASTATLHAQSDITTFILIRHAEKADNSKDPDLSPDGISRSLKLVTMLKEQKVSAVLSTNFKRTRNTVAPLASERGLTIETYESLKVPQLEELVSKHKGGTVVIVGHSNTIPAIATMLSGDTSFKQFDDADYGNLIVISVQTIGTNASVLRLRF